MRALTVMPGKANSISLDEWPEADAAGDRAIVEAVALGICGTDRDIVAGKYGTAPKGDKRLVLGHESLGRVLRAPANSGLEKGDIVVGIVRRPDPVPCAACAGGEWDMCNNGQFTERGIKEAHGYGAERFALKPAFAIKVGPTLGMAAVLLEPASVVAKAWDHIMRIGARSRTWKPRCALITGAGPVGLLAALMSRQLGIETHVYDHGSGPKPKLVADLGATFHGGDTSPLTELQADVVIECTGADSVVMDVMSHGGSDAIVCLAGLSTGAHTMRFNVGTFERRMVLRNDVVFGSVNANRGHFEAALRALGAADPSWLGRLITRRVPLDDWREAFEHRAGNVKTVIEFPAQHNIPKKRPPA